jgi:hypothetical protein
MNSDHSRYDASPSDVTKKTPNIAAGVVHAELSRPHILSFS